MYILYTPAHSPLKLKVPKTISLFHFSWSYILTEAHILLSDNSRISDEDHVEIMYEVIEYFEYETSAIMGFTQMKTGWTIVVDKIKDGITLIAFPKSTALYCTY